MALWPAMRCTPRARITVMIAGRPSGMAEAVRATTIMNISATSWPRQRVPRAKVPTANSRMNSASQRLNPAICRSSGVDSALTCCSMAPMRPSSVAAPVATTRPSAWPLLTRVPE
ncbi:hypothetical protein D9M70_558070 [compost metagenome]